MCLCVNPNTCSCQQSCANKGEPGARGVQGPQGIPGYGFLTKTISLTSAQILTGFSVPVLCIAAPGAGLAIRVIESSQSLTFNTTAYSVQATGTLITDTATIEQTAGVILSATVTTHRIMADVAVTATADTQLIANKALYFKVKTANPTLGNSAMIVYITYEIVTL